MKSILLLFSAACAIVAAIFFTTFDLRPDCGFDQLFKETDDAIKEADLIIAGPDHRHETVLKRLRDLNRLSENAIKEAGRPDPGPDHEHKATIKKLRDLSRRNETTMAAYKAGECKYSPQ